MVVDCGSLAAQHTDIEVGDLEDSDGDGGVAEAEYYWRTRTTHTMVEIH